MQHAMRVFFLFISLVLQVTVSMASEVKFVSVNTAYGVAFRETASLYEDKNGFIWSSSKTGILRLAGRSYKLYSLPYVTTDVGTIKLVGYASQLYAYTSNAQIFVYDSLYDRFQLQMDLRAMLGNKYVNINRITIDADHVLWIASSFGLYRYTGDSIEKIGKESENVQDVLSADDGVLFVSYKGKVEKVHINHSGLQSVDIMEDTRLNNVVRLFYDAQQDRLWVGTFSEGLFYVNFSSKVFHKVTAHNFPSSQPILVIKENTDSTLLVGVDGKGIWELTKDGTKVLNIYCEEADNPSSLRGNGVYDLLIDKNKRLWVATYSGGVSFSEQSPSVLHVTHKVNNTNSLIDNNVNRIIKSHRGELWMSTNNGISRWNRKHNRWQTYLNDLQGETTVFSGLCEDDEGNIWAGTFSSGIYVLDGTSGRILKHFSVINKLSDFTLRFITDIIKDSSGDLWIGDTQSHIVCYLTKEKRFRAYKPVNIGYFAEWQKGKMLLASSTELKLLDKESGESEVLLSGYVFGDIKLMDDRLWLATSGGLLCYEPESHQIQAITTDSGLQSNIINSLVPVGDSLLVVTEGGLSFFSPKNMRVYPFSLPYSLSGLSFNARSDVVLNDGCLALGTNNGLVIINPELSRQTVDKSKIYIQDIFVSGSSIRENPQILQGIPVNLKTNLLLRHNQNAISIDLIPTGTVSSENRFSWKMEGLDTDWSRPSIYPGINYMNLPAGHFRLDVRMMDTSLSRVIDSRTIEIRITPPFWNTWWFYLIVIIVIFLFILYIIKSYTDRLKQRYARDKIRFFINIAHDIRTSLTLIKNPIDEIDKDKGLSEKSHYYLHMAKEQSKKLSLVATQLLDFQKIETGNEHLSLTMADVVWLVRQQVKLYGASAEEKQINLNFVSNQETYFTAIDEQKIEKVIENLLSNAIKYSHNGSKVDINLLCEPKGWKLSVQDYGIGISKNEINSLFREFYRGENAINLKIIGSGIGLLLIRDYVTMHQGKVLLKSKENVGSTFSIEIPYKRTYNPDLMISSIETNSKKSFEIDEVSTPESKMNVLIVEDNDELRSFLKVSLQDIYNIQTAGNGSEAWNLINKKAPNLIISDIMMPEMNGFDLCKRIKSTFETSHIPVILLTALSDKAKELEGLGLGADDYVTKPFDMAVFTQRINTILINREMVREKILKLIKPIDKKSPIFVNELNDAFVKKALQVVEENFSNSEFSRDEFASMMNVSSSLLYNKLKSLTGQSPIELIKTVRLNHAVELLQSKKYTVTEVSELCGFSSANYFGSAFKKHFGKPPVDLLN